MNVNFVYNFASKIEKLSNEIADPSDIDSSLEWYYIEDIIGKLELDYQNKILVNFLKSNSLSKK